MQMDEVLRNNPKNGGEQRLVVPKTLVDEELGLSHDLPVMGYQGVSRTYLRVKEKFYWYNMNQSTKNFVHVTFAVNIRSPTEKQSAQ